MTRYRRIDPEIVEAWQYTGGGVFPDGCRDALEHRQAFWCNQEKTRLPDKVYAATGMTPPEPGERYDYLYWSEDGNNRCYAGDWIVQDEDGRLDIWSDEAFRAAFAPVVDSYIVAIDDHAAALAAERDYHRDDAAMVRRERDVAINRMADRLAEAETENARLRAAYLAAESRIVAAAEERTVGSLASRVAGMYARRDCRRPLRDGDLDVPGEPEGERP